MKVIPESIAKEIKATDLLAGEGMLSGVFNTAATLDTLRDNKIIDKAMHRNAILKIAWMIQKCVESLIADLEEEPTKDAPQSAPAPPAAEGPGKL